MSSNFRLAFGIVALKRSVLLKTAVQLIFSTKHLQLALLQELTPNMVFYKALQYFML